MGLSKSALSQHLGIMREFGLVTRRQDRQKAYYSCTNTALKVLALLAWLVEREVLP
ncbi:ArsR family transcriptional regulator [Mesorhizobium sp. M1066]|uniref:ArsR/SmtB family transcription factor n=1 Tax=unclassified Mesorhizobium TaxID=325217 RepID=UPI0033361B9B